jgi:hypothetical protein
MCRDSVIGEVNSRSVVLKSSLVAGFGFRCQNYASSVGVCAGNERASRGQHHECSKDRRHGRSSYCPLRIVAIQGKEEVTWV